MWAQELMQINCIYQVITPCLMQVNCKFENGCQTAVVGALKSRQQASNIPPSENRSGQNLEHDVTPQPCKLKSAIERRSATHAQILSTYFTCELKL